MQRPGVQKEDKQKFGKVFNAGDLLAYMYP